MAFEAVVLAAVVVALALLGAEDFFAVVVAFLAVDLAPADVFLAVDFVVLAPCVLVVLALAVVVLAAFEVALVDSCLRIRRTSTSPRLTRSA